MEGPPAAALRPARALKLAGAALVGLLVVAALAFAGAALWLRAYAPLDASDRQFAPGPGLGALIAPAVGSGGREVFVPAYRPGRPFLASFTLHNGGRFTVTVAGLAAAPRGAPPWIGPTALLTATSPSVEHTRPFEPFALAPGDSAVLVARFDAVCPSRGSAARPVFADAVRLRYRYLRWFVRTQTVRLPFAVTLRCVGGPLARP